RRIDLVVSPLLAGAGVAGERSDAESGHGDAARQSLGAAPLIQLNDLSDRSTVMEVRERLPRLVGLLVRSQVLQAVQGAAVVESAKAAVAIVLHANDAEEIALDKQCAPAAAGGGAEDQEDDGQ